MGQRANMVIVRGGARTLYYDHWCANRLDVELAWGPDLAVAFVEQREPAGEKDWLDDIWAEGGALIDLDRRLLLWFGGQETNWDVAPRRAALSLFAHTWPGWTVRWAHQGLVDIVDELGLPRSLVLSDRGRELESFRINTAFRDDNDILVTFADERGMRSRRLSASPEALERGPGHLLGFRPWLGGRNFTWTGEVDCAGGVHLDIPGRRMWHWWAPQACAIDERAPAAWPGWSVTWMRDRVEDHLALAGAAVSMTLPSTRDALRRCISNLRAGLNHVARNPAADLDALLKPEWKNPATEIFRGSVGDAAGKARILAALEAEFL